MMKLRYVAMGLLVFSTFARAQSSSGDIEITRDDQTGLGLTVYKDFAVVRDVRQVSLPRGIVEVDYQDVARTIDPTSVRVTSIGREDLFTVEQQRYEYDLLNKESLLQRYIGRKLKYSRSLRTGGSYERVLRQGILLAIDPEIVKFGDEVEISPRGVISLPSIPEGLRTVPTLIWQINNRYKGRQTIATSYIADRFSWSTDYRMDLNVDETSGDLSVWVSVRNQSGMGYHNANVQLVAGDVKHADVRRKEAGMPRAALMQMQSDMVTGKPFFEYYMYKLQGPIDLANNETSQFRLMSAQDVPVRKSYLLRTQVPEHSLQAPLKNWFDVQLTFDNLAKYGLGYPLPQGNFRVFKTGNDGAPQLLGEDQMSHKSNGQSAIISVGKAFDLFAEHTQTSYRRVGEHGVEIGYKVVLHNLKQHKVTVTLDEKLAGDWTIIDQSVAGKRIDDGIQQYTLTLGPGSVQSVRYTVRINN